MERPRKQLWRRLLPWVISAAALAYVFGYATDWKALLDATRQAHMPLFLAATTADRLAFFLAWSGLQLAAVRRFVTHVETRPFLAVKGGSELLRAVSNPLSDGAFFLGLAQLTRGRLDAVLAAALIPTICHFCVLLLQVTLALPFLEGGPAAHRDVTTAAVVGWLMVIAGTVAVRLAPRVPFPGADRLRRWVERIPARMLLPFMGWFVVLAVFDVLIQGVASWAFGVPLPWAALMGGIPILYMAMSLPSFANFGTRELAWSALFAEHAPRDTLIAFAFATNTVFLLLNVLIGVIFLPRAIELVREVIRARRAGEPVPEPLIRDAMDT